MALYQKIAYNVLISLGARVVGTALALFTIGLTTRYLGKEGFGEYSIALAFLYIFNSLADLGFYNILVREISKPGADERKIVSNVFTLRTLSLFLILGLGVVAGWFFPYSIEVKKSFSLIGASYFFLSLSQVLMAVFQKHLRTDKPALAEIGGRTAQLALTLFFVFFDFGFFAIIWALTLSSLLIFLLNLLFVRKYVKFGFGFNLDLYGKILKESFPLAVSGVFILIYFKLDAVLLSFFKPPADVGLYGTAYKILENLIFIPAMFVGVVMPLLSRFAAAEIDNFKKIFQKSFDILILGGIPLVAGGLFLSERIINLIAGRDFLEAAGALNFLLFAVFFIFLGTLFGNSIIALSKQKTLIWIYAVAAVFNVGANLIFIPKYSYLAAAAVTALTEFLASFLMFVLIFKFLRWRPSFLIFGKAVFAGAVMAVFVYFSLNLNLAAIVAGGSIVYFAVLYLIGGISKEDIKLILEIRSKRQELRITN